MLLILYREYVKRVQDASHVCGQPTGLTGGNWTLPHSYSQWLSNLRFHANEFDSFGTMVRTLIDPNYCD